MKYTTTCKNVISIQMLFEIEFHDWDPRTDALSPKAIKSVHTGRCYIVFVSNVTMAFNSSHNGVGTAHLIVIDRRQNAI